MSSLWTTTKQGWPVFRSRLSKHRLMWMALAFLLLLAVGGWASWMILFGDLPLPETLHQRAAAPSTKILDRKGRLLYEIMDPHAGSHSPVPLQNTPLHLQQATVATEDVSFYSNPGLDFKAVLRAIVMNLRGGEVLSGGSTITQQLARNLLLSPKERGRKTLLRKLRESVLAYRLARSYTKDEILALYLNETYYGNLAYGVEAAARAYFGKPVSDLDLAECALLAGLPQSPAAYDPLIDPDAARRRQATVLDLMVKARYVDRAEAELAKEERLYFAASPFLIQAPHFVMHVRRLLEDQFGLEELYRIGLRVHTTLDLDMQRAAEEIVRRRLAMLTENKNGQPVRTVRNGALVALDPQTGEILAMLGSPDYFDPQIDGAVNVTLATRQPGSSIKPITYALAFSRDYTPATMVLDVRTAFVTKEGEPYVPSNYDRRFHGPVLLRDALASSFNLVAVKVLDHVGLDNMIELARSLGVTTFDDNSERFGLALTLGGGEVRLTELAASYGAFANGGRRVEPVAITLIEDDEGNVLKKLEFQPGEQVLDPRVAYLVTDVLSDDAARTMGFGSGSILNLTRPAAAKTGTTTDWRDNWTVGYTPDLVVGVWVGNADNEPMGHVSGVTGAAPIWHDYMEQVLKGRPERVFEEPPGLIRAEVCAVSGMAATPNCRHRRSELFLEGTVPEQVCPVHRSFRMDRATGELAAAGTPADRIVERVFTVLPVEAQDWARERHLPQPPAEWLAVESWQAAADSSARVALARSMPSSSPGLKLIMTSPDAGSSYRLSSQIPRTSQCIEVAARPGDGAYPRTVTFLVDGEPLGGTQTTPPYRTVWCLQAGDHVFQAVGLDRTGDGIESQLVRINVQEDPQVSTAAVVEK